MKKNDRGMDETAGFVGAGVRPGQGSEEGKGEAERSLSDGQTISVTDGDALDTEAGGDDEPSHWLCGGWCPDILTRRSPILSNALPSVRIRSEVRVVARAKV